jgi:uncharacterized damage-inducible protein DinB
VELIARVHLTAIGSPSRPRSTSPGRQRKAGGSTASRRPDVRRKSVLKAICPLRASQSNPKAVVRPRQNDKCLFGVRVTSRPGDRHLLPGVASGSPLDRAGEAQQLLRRRRHQAGVGPQLPLLLRVLKQGERAFADQVDRRLVTGHQQQDHHRHQFVLIRLSLCSCALAWGDAGHGLESTRPQAQNSRCVRIASPRRAGPGRITPRGLAEVLTVKGRMITPQPWFQRVFPTGLPAHLLPVVAERLRGTPARLADHLAGVPHGALVRRCGESWSIQENVGHLLDLEPLWCQRLDDLAARRVELTEADLTNRRTHEANHNAAPLRMLLGDFRHARADLVRRLEAFGEAEAAVTALHPRLKAPMNVVDLACFVAEHDDYHLARITELLRQWSEGGDGHA